MELIACWCDITHELGPCCASDGWPEQLASSASTKYYLRKPSSRVKPNLNQTVSHHHVDKAKDISLTWMIISDRVTVSAMVCCNHCTRVSENRMEPGISSNSISTGYSLISYFLSLLKLLSLARLGMFRKNLNHCCCFLQQKLTCCCSLGKWQCNYVN